jgi:cytochrome oxidase Cu insertion factor (SCO1/SenC/PrrC family)
MQQQTTKNGGRRQLTIILVMALFSLGGSYLVFFSAKSGSSWGTTNNGAFVQPPVTVQQLDWRSTENAPLGTSGQWWLWTVSDRCPDSCQQALRKLRAAHILLNREAKRVRRGLSTGASFETPKDQPDLVRISAGGGRMDEGIYIVDPNGNLVFSYPLDINPKLLLADLKRLLKVSQIG